MNYMDGVLDIKHNECISPNIFDNIKRSWIFLWDIPRYKMILVGRVFSLGLWLMTHEECPEKDVEEMTIISDSIFYPQYYWLTAHHFVEVRTSNLFYHISYNSPFYPRPGILLQDSGSAYSNKFILLILFLIYNSNQSEKSPLPFLRARTESFF